MKHQYDALSWLITITAVIVLAGLPAAHTQASSTFTYVALPDTQNYSQQTPPTIFTSQTQWIVNNQASQNIAFVAHEGDVVQGDAYDLAQEWTNATSAMYLLNNTSPSLPVGVVAGNHDIYAGTPFMTDFGPPEYGGNSWYGGAKYYSSYDTFSAGGRTFLVLNLQYDGNANVISWAQGIINAHLGMPTIVNTHDYLEPGGRDTYGNTMWNSLISPNSQIFMVTAGHIGGEWEQTSTDAAGKSVFEVQADFEDGQYGGNGGNGYMRLYQFDEANSMIHVKTFSPYDTSGGANGTYQTGQDPEDVQLGYSGAATMSQFDLSMNFNDRLGPSTIPEPSTFVLLAVGFLSLAIYVVLSKRNRQFVFQRSDRMITKMKVLLGAVAIAAVLVMSVGPANASSVALVDPSFEANVQPDGGMVPFDNVGLEAPTGGDWLALDTNVVIWRPTSADFPALAGGSLPAPAAGQQCVLNIGDQDSGIGQILPGFLQPHKIYTLTVAFGSPLTYGFTDDALAFAYEDATDPTTGNLLQNQNTPIYPPPLPGTFKDQSFTIHTDDYIVPGAQPGDTDEYGNPVCAAGDNLVIFIELGTGSALDNVRLTVSDVPEPSTLMLLAGAGFSLLAYAWRKRK
jgi:hypothetical protein